MSDATSPRPFEGRTALVTGSGQNIGRAIALAFARDGANVVINGHRNQAAIKAVAEEARGLGVRALAVLADVGDPEAVQTISIEEWQRILNSNLSASFYLARSALPLMQQRGWGRIIHISGRDGFAVIPNRAHNVTCKAGMFALSKAIAVEFGPFGITANTVAPGIIDTTRDWTQYPQFRDGYGDRVLEIPVRRVGHVDEIAAACTYLAGAGFVTGQILHVNGGDALF
jgi:3-oxoacyl-[acyl-carrier protein] reductase